MRTSDIKYELSKMAIPEKAAFYPRFFKTAPGEYGEGDQFIGVTVPNIRKVVKLFCKESTELHISELIHSELHEERLCGLLILVEKYQKGDENEKEKWFNFYIDNRKQVNNWDLVDSTAHKLVGPHLFARDRSLLYKLVESPILWDRRIAVVSTLFFIKNDDFTEILNFAEKLLIDPEDLMHKATGWMLREVGKRDQSVLIEFLEKHCHKMPRTMLRYSMEKLPKELYKLYLHERSKQL